VPDRSIFMKLPALLLSFTPHQDSLPSIGNTHSRTPQSNSAFRVPMLSSHHQTTTNLTLSLPYPI
jgi:hypothetical protein